MELTRETITEVIIKLVGGNIIFNGIAPDKKAILDECINNILDNSFTIDGRSPQNEEEIIECLYYYLSASQALLEGIQSAIQQSDASSRPVITYKGRKI